MTDQTVRTRIAPSPTGDPHVGTGYMGLVNMVLARQHGGQFILRIDDTDRTRYREGSEQAIFDALRWLGIDWDEGPDKGGPKGPYRQSERTEVYREHATDLIGRGRAYRCFCTTERLDALRREQRANKQITRYDGHCRELDPDDAARRASGGEEHVVRLKMPVDESLVVEDLLRGSIELKPDNFQDQVLVKTDGYPTYHFASCVDDHLFEISHIIRAEEWISSAGIHKTIFEGFGWTLPTLCHMPLLRNPDKTKISKRLNPTSLLYYRDAGFLPEALCNFLGLMGWGGPKEDDGSNREVFSITDMLEHFELANLSLGAPVFDLDKLRHVNSVYLRDLDDAAFGQKVHDYWLRADLLTKAAPLVKPRVQTLGEAVGVLDVFLGDISHFTPETRKKKDPKQRVPVAGLIPKDVEPKEAWFTLSDVQQSLEKLPGWTAAELEAACRALATEEATGWKVRDLFMQLRVALCGRSETPPLFETLELLGRSRCLGRITEALKAIGQPSKKAIAKRKKAREKAKAAREKGDGQA